MCRGRRHEQYQIGDAEYAMNQVPAVAVMKETFSPEAPAAVLPAARPIPAQPRANQKVFSALVKQRLQVPGGSQRVRSHALLSVRANECVARTGRNRQPNPLAGRRQWRTRGNIGFGVSQSSFLLSQHMPREIRSPFRQKWQRREEEIRQSYRGRRQPFHPGEEAGSQESDRPLSIRLKRQNECPGTIALRSVPERQRLRLPTAAGHKSTSQQQVFTAQHVVVMKVKRRTDREMARRPHPSVARLTATRRRHAGRASEQSESQYRARCRRGRFVRTLKKPGQWMGQ